MPEIEHTQVKKVGILKLGNIASSVLLEMLLDERADRTDIDIRTISSGAKLTDDAIEHTYEIFSKIKFDLVIVTTPNASLKAPLGVIKKIHLKKQPLVVITDTLKREMQEKFVEDKIGFIIIKADAMIGARREFLDPVEMAIYNSDLLKVLSIGGVLSTIYQEIDNLLDKIINKQTYDLPQMIVTAQKAVKKAVFSNPYAEAKARAALEIAENVAKINSDGCFKIEDRLEYLPQVAAGHEMMRIAASLADEAREIEKGLNKVKRQPHHYQGDIQEKWLLSEKPDSKY